MQDKEIRGINVKYWHSKEQNQDNDDIDFLSGEREREKDLASAGRFFLEFCKGFEGLANIKNCVTVFGSARFDEEHQYYQMAQDLGKKLAEEGFTVMTGGGPGIQSG